MQITINPTHNGYDVEVSNYPHFKKYSRNTTQEVKELVIELLKPIEG